MNSLKRKIVTIIGFGNIGRSIAHLLIHSTHENYTINVLDPSETVQGSILDLSHSTYLENRHRIVYNSVELFNQSDFVFHSAGLGVLPGGTRLDLAAKNVELTYEIFKAFNSTVDTKIIVITNPVDVITYHTLKASGLQSSKVVGTGALVDSIRMNYYLSLLKPDVTHVDAILLGEHGTSIVLAESLSNAGGKSLKSNFGQQEIAECLERTIVTAATIKRTQGASIYGAADSAVYVMRQMEMNSESVKPLTVLVPSSIRERLGSEEEFYMSIPAKIDAAGVHPIEDLVLGDDEWNRLIHSAKAILNAQQN